MFFGFLRKLAKVFGLFVAGFYLDLCELTRFLTGKKRNQSFKFGCCLLGAVSLSEHQVFKFPDCLIVIHISLFRKSVARTANVTSRLSPSKTIIIQPEAWLRHNWTMVLPALLLEPETVQVRHRDGARPTYGRLFPHKQHGSTSQKQ